MGGTLPDSRLQYLLACLVTVVWALRLKSLKSDINFTSGGDDHCYRDSLKRTHAHTFTPRDGTTRAVEKPSATLSPVPPLFSPEIRTMVRLHKVEWQTHSATNKKTWGKRHGSSSAGSEEKVVVINTHFLSTPTRSVHCSPPEQVESEANKDNSLSTTFLPPPVLHVLQCLSSPCHPHRQHPCRQI
ncbi:hypothetical protein B0T20DRAFT_149069 [Sordaria brevicollis]|uniref:Secreted protein n=1 Tax=Sordaria brevicollis TaxID=83679 RepID=A0AAE0PIR7_SORBR|nr:hypothetical protein B0T20DRAFT_149069 [Sordaria brevicollis]